MTAPTYDAATYARLRADAEAIVARYPVPRSALLPMLHLVQAEESYVSPRGIALCADVLGLTRAEVSAVATFYSQYKRHPNGTYTVGVCTNTLCAVLGGDEIFARLSEDLGIGHDETTDDGAITLERIECNAACDYAPVVMVNWEFFDNQTPSSAIETVRRLREGEDVAPTRGAATVCTFREVSRVLAGFGDGRADEGVGAGPATLEGLRIAREQGWTAPPFPAPKRPARPAAPTRAPAATRAAPAATKGPAAPAEKAAPAPASAAPRRRPAATAPAPAEQPAETAPAPAPAPAPAATEPARAPAGRTPRRRTGAGTPAAATPATPRRRPAARAAGDAQQAPTSSPTERPADTTPAETTPAQTTSTGVEPTPSPRAARSGTRTGTSARTRTRASAPEPGGAGSSAERTPTAPADAAAPAPTDADTPGDTSDAPAQATTAESGTAEATPAQAGTGQTSTAEASPAEAGGAADGPAPAPRAPRARRRPSGSEETR